jgi:hypothetical protein
MGPGKVLAGYGQKQIGQRLPAKTKQFSLGYEYSLSKRTYLYVDGRARRKPTAAATWLSPRPSTTTTSGEPLVLSLQSTQEPPAVELGNPATGMGNRVRPFAFAPGLQGAKWRVHPGTTFCSDHPRR